MYQLFCAGVVSRRLWDAFCWAYFNQIMNMPEVKAIMVRLKNR